MKTIILALGFMTSVFAAKGQTMFMQNHSSCDLAIWAYADYGGNCAPTSLITNTISLPAGMMAPYPASAGDLTSPPSPGWHWVAAKSIDAHIVTAPFCQPARLNPGEVNEGYGGDPNCPQYQQMGTPTIKTNCNVCPYGTTFSLTYTPLPGGDVQVDIF